MIGDILKPCTREKTHSIDVSRLCGDVGTGLELSEPEINRLMRAGYLHDVGKIVLDGGILQKRRSRTRSMKGAAAFPGRIPDSEPV
jgi:response regulator RpfG family c-di-GMP phosphodiesterase